MSNNYLHGKVNENTKYDEDIGEVKLDEIRVVAIPHIPLSAQYCIINAVKKSQRTDFSGYVKCYKYDNKSILINPIYGNVLEHL